MNSSLISLGGPALASSGRPTSRLILLTPLSLWLPQGSDHVSPSPETLYGPHHLWSKVKLFGSLLKSFSLHRSML